MNQQNSHEANQLENSTYYLQSVISHSGQQFYGSDLFNLSFVPSKQTEVRQPSEEINTETGHGLPSRWSINDFEEKMDFESDFNFIDYSRPLFGKFSKFLLNLILIWDFNLILF